MSAELDSHIIQTKAEFEKAIEHLQKELTRVRTGKHPQIFWMGSL